jgi:glycosyltransferase involved in cell wall biosynthesis
MKILHITPHLGGGVGKAHAALSAALPKGIAQTFLLLEEPRDRRYADLIVDAGADVVTARDLGQVAAAARAADVVQFEFWNHPRLFECFARTQFPAMRTAFWSHVSGLFRPIIQPGLIEAAQRFVFTTEASLAIPAVAKLSAAARRKIGVINSGFGFADAPERASREGTAPRIAYLGTVDFVKMHRGFFAAIDRLEGDNIRVSVWGDADPDGEVAVCARAMVHPERVQFGGPTATPIAALSAADIFFYPLAREHFGTAENALVEAMSLGLVPVVLDNPAEAAIVSDGETGFVARSIAECTTILQKLLSAPDLRERISRNAARFAARHRTAAQSAAAFAALWQAMLEEPKTACNFRRIVGDSPANWFLATQCLPGEAWISERADAGAPAKGTLAHFAKTFPRDASLSRLAELQDATAR